MVGRRGMAPTGRHATEIRSVTEARGVARLMIALVGAFSQERRPPFRQFGPRLPFPQVTVRR